MCVYVYVRSWYLVFARLFLYERMCVCVCTQLVQMFGCRFPDLYILPIILFIFISDLSKMSDSDVWSDTSNSSSSETETSSDSDTGTESGSEDDRDTLLPEEFKEPEAKLCISDWGVKKLRKLFMGQPLSKEDRQKLTVHIVLFSVQML